MAVDIKFTEHKNQIFYHDFRIFICGAEVTPYVMNNISITLCDRDGTGKSSFELSNPMDIWMITKENLNGQWRNPSVKDVTSMKYSEAAKKQIYEHKVKINKKMYETNLSKSEMAKKYPDQIDLLYPLVYRGCIFHKLDPVRIFIHNPLTEKDEWMCSFTGFVENHPASYNYVTGSSSLTMSCFDIRTPMAKMRVQQNFVITTTRVDSPSFTEKSGFFADFQSPSVYNQSVANLTLEDSISKMILGGQRGDTKFENAVGEFRPGKIFTWDPKNKALKSGDFDGKGDETKEGTNLEAWHTLCLLGYGERRGIKLGRFLTTKEVDLIGRLTTNEALDDTKQETFSPWCSRLYMLLPVEGSGARDIVSYTVDTGSEIRDWLNRWEIIQQLLEPTDYQLQVTPFGDIVLEFPMYDFTPDDFGNFRNLFKTDNHLMQGSFDDEAGEPRTWVKATSSPTFGPIKSAADTAPSQYLDTVLIKSDILAARWGTDGATKNFPFVGSQVAGVDSRARLKIVGMLEFQKLIALVGNMTCDTSYRPFLLPNRPFINQNDSRLGLITTVTNTLNVFKTCTTTADLKFIRNISRDGKTFRYITGGRSMPLSYNELFSKPSATQTGIAGEGIEIIEVSASEQEAQAATQTGGAPQQ